jgi:hypothetical protein
MWRFAALQLCLVVRLCNAGEAASGSIVVGVLTSSLYHLTRVQHQLSSWAGSAAEAAGVRVVFFSDSSDESIPTVRTAGCAVSKRGLPCKTRFIIQYLLREFPDAEWHLRAMDDTFLVLDNLRWHLSQHDPNELHVMGDFFFGPQDGNGGNHEPSSTSFLYSSTAAGSGADTTEPFYPAGGCGWAMSRGAMLHLVPLLLRVREFGNTSAAGHGANSAGDFADDRLFGHFMQQHTALRPMSAADSCFSQSPASFALQPPSGVRGVWAGGGDVTPGGYADQRAAEQPGSASPPGPQQHPLPPVCLEAELSAYPACLSLQGGGSGPSGLMSSDSLRTSYPCRRAIYRPCSFHQGDPGGPGRGNAATSLLYSAHMRDLHRLFAATQGVVAVYEHAPRGLVWRPCSLTQNQAEAIGVSATAVI